MNTIVKEYVLPKIMIILAFFFNGSLRRRSITEFEIIIPLLLQMILYAGIHIGV